MASKKQKNIRQLLVSKKIMLAFTLILTNVSLSLPEIAHAITYDSLQNEYFDTIEDYIGAGTENVGIRFGTTLQESLRFNRTTNMFETSKGVEVHGTMSGESLNVLGSVGISTTPVNAKVHIKNGGTGQKFRIETNASPYSAYLGGEMTGAQDEFGINFGASLATHLADTSSTAWGIEASGTNDYFAIRRGSNNGQGNAVTWTQLFRISNAGNVSIGLGSVNAETKLEVGGTISGTTLYAKESLSSSGTLVTEGRSTFNGVAVFNEDSTATSNVRMEGDTNANLFFLDAANDRVGIGTSTPKATFDVFGTLSGSSLVISNLKNCDTIDTNASGVLTCGVDAGGGSGMSQSDGDVRYVKKSGDTMTGALTIDLSETNAGTGLVLREKAYLGSGATLSGSLALKARNDPAMPSSDTLAVYAKEISGRMMLKAKGPSGLDYPYQPSFFQNMIVMINTNNTTSVNAFGNTVTSAGTLSHPTATEAYGWMTNFATAATANSTAGTGNNGTLWFRGSTTGANGFFYNARLAYPDASYGAGATGARTFIGMTNQTMATMVGSDNPAGHYAGFQFSTNRGDTNWQFTTKNNTTQNVVNTGLPFTAQKVYDVYIFTAPQGTSINWRIDNVTDGTTAEGTASSNLPGGSTALRGGFQLSTLTTTARNIRMQRVYIEADR